MITMTNKECWKAISELFWNHDCDYKRVQNIIYTKWTPAKRKSVKKFVFNRVSDLYKAIKIFETSHHKLSIGDDELSDIIYHIIGLGEYWYQITFFNPIEIEYRYASNQYKEGFAYCFHKPNPIPMLINPIPMLAI